MNTRSIECRPALTDDTIRMLRAGDEVEITGTLLTIRDASAKRLSDLHKAAERLPVDIAGTLLYAVGPSPAKPGQVVGSAGPTTTERFVPYLPTLLGLGARGIIGKGQLGAEVVPTFVHHAAVYLAAIGGLGALLSEHIVAAEVVAFGDLGAEAIFRFEVERLPAVVIIDTCGTNFHETTRLRWRRP